MFEEREAYPPAMTAAGAGGALRQPPSMMERLRERKAALETQLAIVNETIEAMDADPKAARLVDAISKLERMPF